MRVIFVQKDWLDTIGDAADLLLFRRDQNGHVSILADRAVAVFPFVDAQLARKVAGIFDLSEGEAGKMGFHQPKKA